MRRGDVGDRDILDSQSQASELGLANEVEFVNREIDRQIDLFKYINDRMLAPVVPILGLSAAIVPAAAVVLSETVKDQRRFFFAATPILMFTSMLGVVVASRLTRAVLYRTMHLTRAYVLESYFVDRAPDLGRYMPPRRLKFTDLESTLRDLANHVVAGPPVIALLVVSAGLNGVAAGVGLWWVFEHADSWLLVAVGTCGAAASLIAELIYVTWIRRSTALAIADDWGLRLVR